MKKIIIAAVADNGAIGRGNELLWHLPGDMKYFRVTTFGHPVVMGYMTFRSIGRPLPGRLNIVCSWHPFEAPSGVIVTGDLAEAFKAAEASGDDRLFIIGGGETYRQALPTADELYITRVHAEVKDADTFFPVIDPAVWEEKSCSETSTDPETGLEFEFAVYRRR